eukprot:791763-Amphidinium_carterae.2
MRGPPNMTIPTSIGRAAAGPRAYQENVAEARRLLAASSGSPSVTFAEGVSAGRARQSDTALRAAIEQGGSQASMAIQLAMVEALERLGGGAAAASGAQGSTEREPRTLEDFLLGVGGSQMSEERASGAFGGAKGLANMQRLARSIEERPGQWSESFRWGRHADLQRSSGALRSQDWSVCKGNRSVLAHARPLGGCVAADRHCRASAALRAPCWTCAPHRVVLFTSVLEGGKAHRRSRQERRIAHSSRWRDLRFRGAERRSQESTQAAARGRQGRFGPTTGRFAMNTPVRVRTLPEVEAELLRYFESRVVPRNAGRTNLKSDACAEAPRSLLLGLFTSRGLGVTRSTRAHPKLVALVHELGRLRPPSLNGLGYWSVMINDVACGGQTPWHTDDRNAGLNIVHPLSVSAVATGGSLVVKSLDGSSSETYPLSVDQWICFNPRRPHAVERTMHRRLSVTFFSPYRLDQVPDSVYMEARQCGFGEMLGLPVSECQMGMECCFGVVTVSEGQYGACAVLESVSSGSATVCDPLGETCCATGSDPPSAACHDRETPDDPSSVGGGAGQKNSKRRKKKGNIGAAVAAATPIGGSAECDPAFLALSEVLNAVVADCTF